MIEKSFSVTGQLINNALDLARQLHQELTLEAAALQKTQQAELINTLASNKKHLVAQLEEFNGQLAQVLELEQLPNTPESIKEYFKRGELLGLPFLEMVRNWDILMLICTECRTLNEQNGAGIDLLVRHAKRSLDILKGKPEFINTYGSDGSAKSDNYTHRHISV